MDAHPWSSEVDQFLARLLASRFLDYDGFRRASAHVSTGARDAEALDKLCTALIDDGVLTEWQCAKLRQGKFKGFHVDNYCLLSQLETNDVETTFTARDVVKGTIVELAVAKHQKPLQVRVVRVV